MRLHYKKLIRCEFFDSCPSCTGWCLKKKPSAKCVPFLQQAYANTKEARDKQEAKLVKTGIVGDLPVIVGNTHFKKGVKYYQCGSCGMFTTRVVNIPQLPHW